MTHIHKREIDGVMYEFYDSDDLFDYGQAFDETKLSTFNWYEHEKHGLFIIETPKETIGLRLETMQSIPPFAKAMNTLKQWYPNNIITKPTNLKVKTKLNTMYDFLARNYLIEDKPNERLKELLGVQADTVKALIRGEVMRDKCIHLTSFTMNQEKRSSAYWEKKYSSLIGLQAGGTWDIVDFYYDEDGTLCELGHPIKRVVIVEERATGVRMQYGEHCIEDFLIIKENELKTLRSYFQKYKDLLVEYWLLAEAYTKEPFFHKLQTQQVELIHYLLKQNLMNLSTKRSIHQNIRTGKRDDLEDGLSNTDVLNILQLHKSGILVPQFMWCYVVNSGNIFEAIKKYFLTKPFRTSIDDALAHYMRVLAYGPYGYNMADLETHELFTNYLGQPVTKKDMEAYVKTLEVTSTQKRYKTYIGNDIIKIIEENLNIAPQLDAFAHVYASQLHVVDEPEASVVYNEEEGSVTITYKGYERVLQYPFNFLFKDLQAKNISIADKVITGSLRLASNDIYTTDILNYEQKGYTGLYDFLKNIGDPKDMKFYSYVVDNYSRLGLEYYGNKQEKAVNNNIAHFMQFWKQHMVPSIHADPHDSQLFNTFLKSACVTTTAGDKQTYLNIVDKLETQGIQKEAEKQALADAKAKEKEPIKLTEQAALDYLAGGATPLRISNNVAQFLKIEHTEIVWTPETLAYLKYVLKNYTEDNDEHRYQLVLFAHTLLKLEVVDKPTQAKLNFIGNKVYETAVRKQYVTQNQWKYGGADILATLRGIYSAQVPKVTGKRSKL